MTEIPDHLLEPAALAARRVLDDRHRAILDDVMASTPDAIERAEQLQARLGGGWKDIVSRLMWPDDEPPAITIADVERLHLNPGDVLVVHLVEPVEASAAWFIKQAVERVIAPHRALVVSDGIRLTVLDRELAHDEHVAAWLDPEDRS